MWDRIRGSRSQSKRHTEGTTQEAGTAARASQPLLEVLEDRQLLAASLQPISNLTVPSQQGYTVPLLAASGATDPQTYTVTSSNPDIAASIAQGPFWTVGVSYTDPKTPANNFTGTLTFQLFQNFTPNTVSHDHRVHQRQLLCQHRQILPPDRQPAFPSTDSSFREARTPRPEAAPAVSPGRRSPMKTSSNCAFTGIGPTRDGQRRRRSDSNDTQFFITHRAAERRSSATAIRSSARW